MTTGSVKPPQTPAHSAREVVITEFGARGDGVFVNTRAINEALESGRLHVVTQSLAKARTTHWRTTPARAGRPRDCGQDARITLHAIALAFEFAVATAEAVAEQVVEEVRRYLAAQVLVGEHLADQRMRPLVLAGGGACKKMALSRRAVTNRHVIGRFLAIPSAVEDAENRNVNVRLGKGEGS